MNKQTQIDLVEGKTYQVKIFGIGGGWRDGIYHGKLQVATPTQNEVHGFLGRTGIYAVTIDDIQTRVKQ